MNIRLFFLTAILFTLPIRIFTQSNDTIGIDLEDVENIEVKGDISVTVEKGVENKLELVFISNKANEDFISAKSENESLIISAGINFSKDIEVRATLFYNGDIKSLKATNGGRIYINKEIKTDSITIEVINGGNIKTGIDANYIYCKTTSGGIAQLSGTAKIAFFESFLGSTIDANNMTLEDATCKANSQSLQKIMVTKKLNASASVGGTIIYKGENIDLTKEEKMGGTIYSE